jgi:hypothetical protein
MISGAHSVIYSKNPEAGRSFAITSRRARGSTFRRNQLVEEGDRSATWVRPSPT